MKTLFRTQFGSHVYGTNTPTSDLDYKEIFIPTASDILLQRAPRTIVHNTKLDKGSRNTADDVDTEKLALHQFFKLLLEGQTMALDMLFTPEHFWEDASDTWHQITQQKKDFLHSGTVAFVGYARQQASKYGIKGSRVSAMRDALDFLTIADYSKLVKFEDRLRQWVAETNNEYISIVDCKGPNGQAEPHLQVCGRKIPFHATFKYAREVFQRIFDEYGARALLAEKNEGVDWKALMHAVRVAGQAKELLTTANIIFPRPEAEVLLQIRKGELPYKQVAEMIENGLVDLEYAKEKSVLPTEPNQIAADEIIQSCYGEEILEQRYPYYTYDEHDFL